MDFNDSDDDNDAEDLAKSIQPAKNQPSKNDKNKLNDFEDDFEDDDENADPWNLDSKSKPAGKPAAEVKPIAANSNANNNKSNPFDQKVKPAFDDLEDIGFDLDSDRPIEFNNNKSKPAESKQKDLFGVDNFSKNKNSNEQEDNGLIVDDDFGDDLEDNYEDDFDDGDDADNKNKSQKLGGMLGAAAAKAAVKDSHDEDDDDDDDIFENSRTNDNKPAQS